MAWHPPKRRIASDQRRAQRFCKSNEDRVVGGQVVSHLPDAVAELYMRIADQDEFAKVRPRVRNPLIAELSSRAQAPQGVQNLDIDEVRSVEIAIMGNPLDQTSWCWLGDERCQHR